MRKILTYIELFLGMAVYGSTLPVSKIVTEHFPVFTASFLRLIAAVIFLAPFIIKYRHSFIKISRKDYVTVFLIAFSGVFLFSVFMLYGMKYASGVSGSIVMSATPAITALGAYLFFKDSFGLKKILAILLSVAGIVIANISGSHSHHINESIAGVILVFLAVCSEASYTLFAKKIPENINALQLTFLTALVSMVLFIIPSVYESKDLALENIPSNAWLALLWWGAGGMGLATLLWFDGVKKVSGSIASGFMGVMSVSALVLSYIILSEKFMWIHIAGFAAVFTGVVLVSFSDTEEMN
jgi:drug/metabolite transporter (DMT)-like permease